MTQGLSKSRCRNRRLLGILNLWFSFNLDKNAVRVNEQSRLYKCKICANDLNGRLACLGLVLVHACILLLL